MTAPLIVAKPAMPPVARPIRMATIGAAPCRLCKATTFLADGIGPVHRCCLAWAKVITAGYKCPACKEAKRVEAAQKAGRPVKAPPPLPLELPDGSPFVPLILTEPLTPAPAVLAAAA